MKTGHRPPVDVVVVVVVFLVRAYFEKGTSKRKQNRGGVSITTLLHIEQEEKKGEMVRLNTPETHLAEINTQNKLIVQRRKRDAPDNVSFAADHVI